MKVYITIKHEFKDEKPEVDKFTLNRKWDENTFLSGLRKDDFDWLQCSKPNCFFGRYINDPSVTAFVCVYK